jgi:hypothetical protein
MRVVAPQISLQAVDKLPVTLAELHWTEGPMFCKRDTKRRMRTAKMHPTNADGSKSSLRTGF